MNEVAERIVNEVAQDHVLPASLILGPSRRTDIVLARREAAYRLYHEADLGVSAVGRALNRDHSTIIHAISQYERSRR